MPLLKDFKKELKDVLRQKIDFVINNSNYTVDYITSIDFMEFYEIVFLVQKALTQKAKQI